MHHRNRLRFFATEAKEPIVIPPPPPHKYKKVGDFVRMSLSLFGLCLGAYIATATPSKENHWLFEASSSVPPLATTGGTGDSVQKSVIVKNE